MKNVGKQHNNNACEMNACFGFEKMNTKICLLWGYYLELYAIVQQQLSAVTRYILI